MPSVGSLLITLKAETEGMRADLDKAKSKIREFEGQAVQSGKRAEQAFSNMDSGNMLRGIAKFSLLMSSASKNFADAQTKAFGDALEGASKIAMAAHVGGAGFALLIGGLETYAALKKALDQQELDRVKDLEEHTKTVAKLRLDAAGTLKSLLDAQKSEGEKLADQVEKIAGTIEALQSKLAVSARLPESSTSSAKMSRGAEGSTKAEIADQTEILRILTEQKRVADAKEMRQRDALSKTREITALEMQRADIPSNEIALLQQINDLSKERSDLDGVNLKDAKVKVRDLTLEIEGTQQLLDLTRQINRERADKSLQREVDLLRAVTDEETRQVQLNQKIEDLRKQGASDTLISQYVALKAREPMLQFVKGLSQTLESGITDAIVSGVMDGWDSAAQIWRNVVRSLLTQTIQSLVGTLLQSVVGSIGGALGGGGGGGIAGIVTAIAGGVGGVASGGGGGSVVSDIAPILGGGAGCEGGT